MVSGQVGQSSWSRAGSLYWVWYLARLEKSGSSEWGMDLQQNHRGEKSKWSIQLSRIRNQQVFRIVSAFSSLLC